METAEGSVPDGKSAARLSYLLFAASLAAYYFVPLMGTLSMSDLSWAASSGAIRRSLVLPTALLLATPFIVGALAWGLGARRGLRAGFSALCRELTWFLVIQGAAFAFVSSWGRGTTRYGVVALWVVACLGQTFFTARRCARVMRDSFGLGRPLVAIGLSALAVSLFEFILFIGEGRGALLRTADAVGGNPPIELSWPLPEAAYVAPADDAAPEYRRAQTLLTPMPSSLSDFADSIIRGGWRDPQGRLAAQLSANQAAMAAFRAGSRRPGCGFSDPRKRVEHYFGDQSPQLSYIVGLTRLVLLDARRAESQGRAAAAADDYAVVLAVERHLLLQQRGKDASYYTLVATNLSRRLWPPLSQYLEKDLGSASDDAKLRDALLRLDAARPPLGRGPATEESRWFEIERKRLVTTSPVLRAGLREKALQDFDAETRRAYDAFYAGAREDPAVYARYLDDLTKRTLWMYPDSAAAASGRADRCVYHPGRLGECWGAKSAMWLQDMVRNGLHEQMDAADTRVLATAAALRARERSGHQAPALLAALAPEIPQPLLDPFADAPLHYTVDRLGRWVVYSVGPDHKDDKALALFADDFIQDWRNPPPGDIVVRGTP